MANALTRMRTALRAENADEQLEKSLLFWARAYLIHCNNDEPEQLDRSDVERFLTHLSGEKYAGRPAQNRALEAVQTLYRTACGKVPAWLQIFIEERRNAGAPNILSREEVRRLLAQLKGRDWLVAALVYGTGIRLLECVRLRVRDIDVASNQLLVRSADDRILRRLPLPDNIRPRLEEHIEVLKLDHIRDIVEGAGRATLPPVIAARQPNVGRNWGWQYLFPIKQPKQEHDDPGQTIHHVDPQSLHRQIERAAVDANIYRRVTGHVLRNSFAIHMIQQGIPVKRVEQILGTREYEDSSNDSLATREHMHLPIDSASDNASVH